MGVAYEEEPMQRPTGDVEKIFVSVRLRPLSEKEIARNDVSDWECINDATIMYRNNLSVSERSMYPTVYTFDRVFSPDCSTRQVYEQGAKEVALSGVSGINSSVFAYGQTSSGKTFTMSGITEYTVADVFDYIEKHKEREFVLKFSALEIYNESVRDLLSTDSTPLRLLDDPERGTVVEKLSEETIRDWSHFQELLSFCEAQRQIGETSLNETSSRSHQILRLAIESSAREFLGNDKSSTLMATVNFVDLAGSERASQTLSAGVRLKEGCHINRSLLTLGTVIRKLSKGRNGHIPFRDSKLTRILQSSLGGNARTAIICTMSPARTHVEQSRNTLLFASCAKEVSTNAQVNVVMSDKALVKQLQRELARLENELRNAGPNSVGSDSTALLREKDLQIEKLRKEVAELSQQLHAVQSQVQDLVEAAEEHTPSVRVDADCHYPKLRVRHSWRSENSISYSPVSEDPQTVDVGLRSFSASQFSDVQSSCSSEGQYIQLIELEDNFPQTNSSPELSIRTTSYGNDNHGDDGEQQTNNISGDLCKDVQCIEKEESSTNRCGNVTFSSPSSDGYVSSNAPSTLSRKINSGLTEVENEDKENEVESPQQKDLVGLTDLYSAFVIQSPEKPLPCLMEEDISIYKSLNLVRSRSCRARLMHDLSTWWLEEGETNDSTPPIGLEKGFIWRPQGYQRKVAALKFDLGNDIVPRNVSQASVTSAGDDDCKVQRAEPPTDCLSSGVSNSGAGLMLMDDPSVQDSKMNSPDIPMRSVKDVGLDPIPDDAESAPKWPLEFKRLQMEIIDLWHACNVSLVHRTYFFLLFKGDPTDSFYMEVELRRLSFLKETFSQGKKAMVDGRILTFPSSKRALNQEKRMLCMEMQKRLSREERENLFLKWGVALNSSHRRLQLANCLWTNTTNMDQISESASLVAKLVGFEEQAETLKEMFGLLNFTPNYQGSKRSSLWRRTVMSFL
ncbi:hypothetical protein K2173_023475 [Erythroxylum novogranatense]|uniref:Kinesin-like protein n=1 Tax=Erythroxylum novogranatense TaxID=1862640 RepID=A0AAV8TZ86_9ROSI|nr:hypothetical protein K2173_023475 [Erythroxylum novogranatense]